MSSFNAKITPKDLIQDITLERLSQFMRNIGEDFVDQNESLLSSLNFSIFVKVKRPDISDNLNDYLLEKLKNYNYYTVQDIQHFYEEHFEEKDGIEAWEVFYTDYAEFANTTNDYRARVNGVLLEVEEEE